jgi:DNA-binding LacI/PurR family transcriptional regulator
MGQVRIKDVALAADVSITTVSHALNGKGRLPPATRERVRTIAEELGYRPSSPARNLGGRRTGLISIALAQDEGHCVGLSDFAYFLQLVRAATEAAVESGYALVLSSQAGGSGSPLDTLNVDGGIVIDPVCDDPHVARLRAAGAAVVTTGRVPGEDGGCWSDNDHPRGLRRLLDHLAERGARRVALVGIPLTTTYAIETRETYDDWCAARGQEPVIQWADGDLTEAAGFRATEQLLDGPTPPDAICTPLDRLALGALLSAEVKGCAVPEDLLVACVTNGESTRAARPPLTALELYPERIGAAAVEMLVDLIEDREPAQRQVVVPTRLIPRASTKRLRSRAAR